MASISEQVDTLELALDDMALPLDSSNHARLFINSASSDLAVRILVSLQEDLRTFWAKNVFAQTGSTLHLDNLFAHQNRLFPKGFRQSLLDLVITAKF